MARERIQRTDSDTPPTAPAVSHGITDLSIAEIRQLIALMNGSDLDEIIIEHRDGLKLVLRKPAPGVVTGMPVMPLEIEAGGLDGAQGGEPSANGKPHDDLIEIGAPLVGVYRARVKPGDEPLIHRGDVIREGQVVAAVEALNYVNEIESSAAGRVKEIFVRDGEPVEYGQPLLAIEPK